jgi:hypothetical protein
MPQAAAKVAEEGMALTRRDLVAGSVAGAASPSLAWAATDMAPLWVISEGSARVFLAGEGGATAAAWASARIEAAFDESAAFWRETPAAQTNSAAKFIARGVDRSRPLMAWLSPAEQARVRAAAAAVGTDFGALAPLEPWLAAVALNEARRKRFDAGLGADILTTLTERAKAAGKPVQSEFADIAAVIDFFAALSPKAQVQYLLLQAMDVEAGPTSAARRAERWAAGDLSLETREAQRIARLLPDAYAEVVVARNARWPARIQTMLKGGGTSLVLVGGDHLVGPKNTLAQLAAAGLRATRR